MRAPLILHLDMDAFFASVEQLDRPELKGQCVVVGGRSPRAVVAAASYEARAFGVHSAMPMFQALQKCPQAIVVPPHRRRYRAVSHQIMSILREFSPLVEPVSIDEAFVDISGSRRYWGQPREIGLRIKTEVRERVHLTCSVGIASIKFLAKIASDLDKPDGLTVIAPSETIAFLQNLPIAKVPGVGRKADAELQKLGVGTLGDVPNIGDALLMRRLGKFGLDLKARALGRDTQKVTPVSTVKSVSSENTLARDTRNKVELEKWLLRHAEDVGRQLRRKGFRARTVTLKIKYFDFQQITRSKQLPVPTSSTTALYHGARQLLQSLNLRRQIRLIGLGASGLSSAQRAVPTQLDLFVSRRDPQPNWNRLEETVDRIKTRFGADSLKRASLYLPDQDIPDKP
jgi:DNA polymerase-4